MLHALLFGVKTQTHTHTCRVSKFVILGVFVALWRGTHWGHSQGRGTRGQLCPSLLHTGCQPGLPSLSWGLHRCAVHLSARLRGQLHSEPGIQKTQVGSSLLSPPGFGQSFRSGVHNNYKYGFYYCLLWTTGLVVCLWFAGKLWKVRKDWAEPFKRSVY